MPEVFLEHFHHQFTYRLLNYGFGHEDCPTVPTALAFICVLFMMLCTLFFRCYSFTLCPLSMSCTSGMLEQSLAETLNLKSPNKRLGCKGTCCFPKVFFTFLLSLCYALSNHLCFFCSPSQRDFPFCSVVFLFDCLSISLHPAAFDFLSL